jgi:hypothetical protein
MDHPITFVVRVTVGASGRLSGIVERVRTGEKERFAGAEALGPLVARMALGGDAPGPEDSPRLSTPLRRRQRGDTP